jgi:hypothetical protein
MEPPAFVERRTIEFSEAGVLQVVHASLRAAGAFGLPSMPPGSPLSAARRQSCLRVWQR